MLSQNSTLHPLFVRLHARDDIFKSVQPSSLILESDSGKRYSQFVELFKKPVDQQIADFSKEKSKHAEIFAKLLSKRDTPESINLLLAFIDQLFDANFTSTMKALQPHLDSLSKSSLKILINYFKDNKKYPFLVRTILLLLGAVLSHPDAKPNQGAAATFIEKATELLGGEIVSGSLALEGLKRLLSVSLYREMFIEKKGVKLLIDMLQAAGKLSQNDTTYHILFCIWALTYSTDGSAELSKDLFVSILARMLSVQSVKSETENIIRLMIAIVKQLNSNAVFIESAYDNDILRLVRVYQNKHFVDPDLGKMIHETADTLRDGLKHLSLWDKYVREVKSGTLKFSISHKSEIFWKNHIERFGDGNYAILHDLKKLLKSDDEETVVVACHDLGEYATRSPVGRMKLHEIGVKELVVNLVNSDKQAIQREALRTTQLLLLRNQI